MNAPETRSFSYGKECRLRHRTLVEGLFSCGKGLYEYPLRLQWRALNEGELSGMFKYGVPNGIGTVQAMVTVPKRKRRRAVDRVLCRRRVRECFRLRRYRLDAIVEAHPEIATLQLAFIYLADENVDYAVIEKKMDRLIDNLIKKLSAHDENSSGE